MIQNIKFKDAFEKCPELVEIYCLDGYESFLTTITTEQYKASESIANKVLLEMKLPGSAFFKGVSTSGGDVLFKYDYEKEKYFSKFFDDPENEISSEYVFFCIFMEYQDCGFQPVN